MFYADVCPCPIGDWGNSTQEENIFPFMLFLLQCTFCKRYYTPCSQTVVLRYWEKSLMITKTQFNLLPRGNGSTVRSKTHEAVKKNQITFYIVGQQVMISFILNQHDHTNDSYYTLLSYIMVLYNEMRLYIYHPHMYFSSKHFFQFWNKRNGAHLEMCTEYSVVKLRLCRMKALQGQCYSNHC